MGINPLVNRGNLRNDTTRRLSLAQADARHIPLATASVNRISSVAQLEHILVLERALPECHRVLVPGGLDYADFGPISPCSPGHHVYARVGDEEARHWQPGKNPVPIYAHLLFTREALRDRLQGRVPNALLEAILEWIYIGYGINRLFIRGLPSGV